MEGGTIRTNHTRLHPPHLLSFGAALKHVKHIAPLTARTGLVIIAHGRHSGASLVIVRLAKMLGRIDLLRILVL